MMFIAQDWLVLDLSNNSATALGVVTALQFVPVLLLTLLSGRLADRYDKRHLLFIANGAWAVLALIMSVLVLTGVAQLWHIFVFAGLLGVATAIENPVRQAFVVRAGRRAAAAQRARPVGGHVQHRPGRRPGDRRRRHRRFSTSGRSS